MDAPSLADRAWPLLGRVIQGHVLIYRATHGVIGHRIPGGAPMLLLEHVGARSATRRTTPLVYGRDGQNVVLIASKGGHPKHPAWYHNLLANPDTTIQVGSSHSEVRARVAEGEERERLWQLMVGVYSGYEGYQRRTERQIPVVVLEPR